MPFSWNSFRLGLILAAITLFLPALRAADIVITVLDPSKAAVKGASVRMVGSGGITVASGLTDNAGRVNIVQPEPGVYSLIVEQSGFETFKEPLTVGDQIIQPRTIVLELEKVQASVEVGSKRSALANSDPNYQALRNAVFGSSYRVENLTLKRDVGSFLFKSGVIDFIKPVLGRVVMGVFTGEGEFRLEPHIPQERDYLSRLTGKPSVSEPFRSVVLCFTDGTHEEITTAGKAIDEAAKGGGGWNEFRDRMRRRSDEPRSLWEALLGGEDAANLDADLLAELYDASNPRSFSAYIHGNKHGDLRFFVKPHGVLPQLPSPEEVALIRFDPGGESEGVWYLSHLESEWKEQTASSEEDKRAVAAEHYHVETAIGGNDRLSASCEMRYRALRDGARVLKFALLPSLRVTRVTAGGKELSFIQEARKQDGSFYVVLPEPLRKGAVQTVTIEYEGNKVVEKAGDGNFFVRARTSWYPNVNAFTERSTFDLTFKVPKNYGLISVGKLVKEWKEDNYAASHWVSEVPLAVAGFNYGIFKLSRQTDAALKYDVETYATREAPSYLKHAGAAGNVTPSRMAETAMAQTMNSMRIFTQYFGELPYGRIAITQQPDFSFGQSWPTLVYLPVSAFLDSTTRWMLLGQGAFRFAEFIDEVTPHEVAHQWWGHIVGWASYHDQWLSEGFADFSAGLYLQLTEPKPDKFITYWDRARKRLFEKNEYGISPNDTGPIWMGLRLNTFKTPGGYSRVVYPKGGFVLHMLRQMMYDAKTGDERFIAMMREFVKSHHNRNASTESFKAIAEKHMTRDMDLDGNQRLDWFFSQWVFGSAAPRYLFEYSVTPGAEGTFVVKGRLTQSGVPDGFRMRVPLYLDIDGRLVRAGMLYAAGSNTMPEFEFKLPKKPKRVLVNALQDVLAVESTSKEIAAK
jgi:hypothetical protein